MEKKEPCLFMFEKTEGEDVYNLRVENYKGEYWFSARDICYLLGIQRVGKALSRVEGDIRTVKIEDEVGRIRDIAFLDLYAVNYLLFQNDGDLSKNVRAWFYSTVYPELFIGVIR